MPNNWNINIHILEQGHIFFFYKPKKKARVVKEFKDVGKFYVVLKPENSPKLRFIILGIKRMPASTYESEKAWGLVAKVGGRGYKTTVVQSDLKRPRGARPAGEGTYALVKHMAHTHLAYHLELPNRLGEVQKTLQIGRQGNYVVTIKNPRIPTPYNAQITQLPYEENQSAYRLVNKFQGKHYISIDPPQLLDYEGSAIFIIGVSTNINKLGLSVNKEKETEISADIFNTLKLNKHLHPITPLIKGDWE